MKRLSGQEAKRVQQALLSGFSYEALKEIARFDLETALEDVAAPGSMHGVTLALLTWAEQNGKVEKLLRAVIAARPDNPDVAALGELLRPAANDPTTDLERRLAALSPEGLARLVAVGLGERPDDLEAGLREPLSAASLIRWARERRRIPDLHAALSGEPTAN